MLATYATAFDEADPLTGLAVGELQDPDVPDGWTTVTVRAAALNHHDIWSLRGAGLREEQLPMILGCDAAGIDDQGNEVIVHSVIADPGWSGDETLDPKRSLLSERFPGTFSERVAVPQRNLVPKPPELSFVEAACLPTAWLTAYRMLFTRANVAPGATVLVQGAGGGVATAAIVLGSRAGLRIWATSRSRTKREESPGTRCRRGVRTGSSVARASGRGARDRRGSDLAPLDARPSPGRDARGVRGHKRLFALRGAQPPVLSSAERGRLDDGHARGARTSGPILCRLRRKAGCARDTPAGSVALGLRRDARGRGLRQDRLHGLGGVAA
jgi:Alcohol dehydrogenase GroES-like domain